MSDAELKMWSYWRDKHGIVVALEDYFEIIYSENIDLQVALAQLKNAERAINFIMNDLGELQS